MDDVAGGGALEFRSQQELETWLETQPRDVSIVIATRAALRVVPKLKSSDSELQGADAQKFARFCAAVIRAIAVARVACKYPAWQIETAAAVNSIDAEAGEFNAAFGRIYAIASAAHRSVAAAVDSGHAAAQAARAVDSSTAVFVTRERRSEVYANMAAAWAEVSLDARYLASGRKPAALANEPIWHGRPPQWATDHWAALRKALPKDEHWDVWIAWYAARLKKSRWSQKKELIYATVPLEKWEQGPAAANMWIFEELEKLKKKKPAVPPKAAIPDTRPAGAQFSGGGDAPIDIVGDPPASDPRREQDQRETWDELRDLARKLAAVEANLLGPALAGDAADVVAALPEDMDAASIRVLWMRANSLREWLAAHDEALERRKGVANPEPDPAELPLACARPLRAFVKGFNIWIVGDRTGLELEAQSLGPVERARSNAALEDLAPVVADLNAAPDVATARAREVLQEEIEAGVKAPAGPLGDKDVALAKDTGGNFVLRIIHWSRDYLKGLPAMAAKGVPEGAFREIGKGALFAGGAAAANAWPQVIEFVHRNADNLIAFSDKVWNAPGVVQIIEMVRHLF